MTQDRIKFELFTPATGLEGVSRGSATVEGGEVVATEFARIALELAKGVMFMGYEGLTRDSTDPNWVRAALDEFAQEEGLELRTTPEPEPVPESERYSASVV